MTRLSFLRKLFAHMEWADALVWQAVLGEEAARQDDYVIEGLVHLHMVQFAYLDVWRGESVIPKSRGDFGEPTEVCEWARSYHPRMTAFLDTLSEDRLDDTIAIPWTEFIEKEIGGPASPASVGDMVLQVASHSVHHRAQVNRRIREVGGSPSMVDYIGWVWRGCPPPDWPVT